MAGIVIAFDLYGTLLSTESTARQLERHVGSDAPAVAATWRTLQLEYTWRQNSMDAFTDFSILTKRALKHALAQHGRALNEFEINALIESYNSLEAFEDVGPSLEALTAEKHITAVIFSNGGSSMIKSAIEGSPDLRKFTSTFKKFVSVESTGKFKPAPVVYRHLARSLGRPTTTESMGEIWLVSANPFDIVGARAMGMKTAWVNRSGKKWDDCLVEGDEGQPAITVTSLSQVVKAVQENARR